MIKKFTWGAALSVGAICAVSVGSTPSYATIEECADFAERVEGDRLFRNNIVNRGGFPGVQCLADQGWVWDWGTTPSIRSYPNVVYGHQPWSSTSTTDELPIRIADLESLVATFEFDIEQEGVNNSAFSMWLTRGSPSADTVTSELMVWIDRNGDLTPAGTLIEVVELDGRLYDLYVGIIEGWRYITYLAHETQLSGELDLADFLDASVERMLVDDQDFLANVEFGNEIAAGTGATTIVSLTYDIAAI